MLIPPAAEPWLLGQDALRRPRGVPLVYQAISWQHGVFLGASVKSEATAAAEHKGKVVMHDPFSMRPFFGYNFGAYLQHWLDMGKRLSKPPQFFMVNWFRKGQNGGLLWPGFGDNIRVIQWILGINLLSFITNYCQHD